MGKTIALKMEMGKYSNPFLTLSGRVHRVKNTMGKNRGRKVTSAIPKMRYNVSSSIPYFSPLSPPAKELVRRAGSPSPLRARGSPEPEAVDGEGMSFFSMTIPIPETRRAVRMIYQFPGNAHLKKSEDSPAITMIKKWWIFLT
jgi:hypothetical protein